MAYFANSSEGSILDEQCHECFYMMDTEENPRLCPIHAAHMMYNYDQLNAGNEQLREALNILVDQDGQCQVKILVDDIRKYKPEDKDQLKMFT